MTDPTEYRIEKALAFAPIIPSAILIIIALVLGSEFNSIGFYIITTCCVVSYLSTILIGWPIFNLLKRVNRLNLCTLSLMGMLAGGLILTLIMMSIFGVNDFLLTLLWGAGFGLFISLPFGLIAGVKVFNNGVNPNRKY